MNFDLNYPNFGFPVAVNKPVFQVNLMTVAATESVVVPVNVSTLILGVVAAIPVVNVQLSKHQQFPLNIVVNNPSASATKVTFDMNDADNMPLPSIELTVATKKQNSVTVAPSAIAEMFTVIPIAEAEATESTVTMPTVAQRTQPGAPDLTATVAGDKITFEGKIAYFTAQPDWGRQAGNYVGVKIGYPTGADLNLSQVFLNGKQYNAVNIFTDGADKNELEYFPLISYAGQTIPMLFQWVVAGQVYEQRIQIVIDSTCTLAPATEAVID